MRLLPKLALALSSILPLTPVSSQVYAYGDDRNDSPLFVAGDPPSKPLIGRSMVLEWYLDGLWTAEAHSILFFGFDWSQEANVCFHSPDVDHLRLRLGGEGHSSPSLYEGY